MKINRSLNRQKPSTPSSEHKNSPEGTSTPENQTTAPVPGETAKPLIEMREIVKVYKTHAGDFTALKGVNADFYPGQFVSIIGKSGSGKSTLLNMITGIDRPSSGEIQIGDTFLQELSESQFSVWRGRNLGIVFQFFQLLPMLSLLENTILPMDFCHMYTPPERETRARELLQMVGLQDFVDKLPSAVSGGQVQCAAIARALANDPPIIVADEPTGNLDSRTADMVLDLIDELVKKGKTVVVVTHDEAVARHASRTLVICDGELVDEEISRALPHISHKSMLMVANEAVDFIRKPGEILFSDANEIPGVVVVVEGHLNIRNSEGRKTASLKTGDVVHKSFLKKTMDIGKVFSCGSHAPVRLKVLSEENLQTIKTQSRSFRVFMEKLEIGASVYSSINPEAQP
jgi:putative ABC transport system ATP-binding protein